MREEKSGRCLIFCVTMPNSKSFKTLDAWKVCHELMLEGYKFCEFLPNDEKYNRVSQIKRAVSSPPANVAEGYGRYHWQEAIQFCRQARGSIDEVSSHVIAARDLGQAPEEECEKMLKLCRKARSVINGYIRFLRKKKKDFEKKAKH